MVTGLPFALNEEQWLMPCLVMSLSLQFEHSLCSAVVGRRSRSSRDDDNDDD
jgi:hypothetical protein